MNKNKRLNVMLVCGSGIATSTMVYPVVEDILRDGGYNYRIIKGNFHDIKNHANLDLVLTTMASLPQEIVDMNIPIVHVAPLLYGDKANVEKNIYDALEKMD